MDIVCWICGNTVVVPNYNDGDCQVCGAQYEYEEGHRLTREWFTDNWPRPNMDSTKPGNVTRNLIAAYEAAWKGEPLGNWPRPIPVSERLPELGSHVLVYDCEEWCVAFVGSEDGLLYIDIGRLCTAPTHWLPLPPKPLASASTPAPDTPGSNSGE